MVREGPLERASPPRHTQKVANSQGGTTRPGAEKMAPRQQRRRFGYDFPLSCLFHRAP